MYDPVYSTPFQVYYKTAIFNPESHSESYEVLSIKKKPKQNDERAAFFLSLCLATAACPLMNLREEKKDTELSTSPVWPSHREVASQIR